MPVNPSYYKFGRQGSTENPSWHTFVSDDNNSLWSYTSASSACPAPNSNLYQLGLREGANCIQLIIEDGGPNDSDSMSNGTVVDPGGVATTLSINADGKLDDPILASPDSEASDSGGGALSWGFLILSLSLILNGLVSSRKLIVRS